MPKRDPGPSVKGPDLHEALRDDGASKEKAARISNAAANTSRSAVGRKGATARDYDERSKADLKERAKEPLSWHRREGTARLPVTSVRATSGDSRAHGRTRRDLADRRTLSAAEPVERDTTGSADERVKPSWDGGRTSSITP